MYNLADFRKDWRWMLMTSVIGFIAVGVLLIVFEDYDLFHELRWDRDSLAEASAWIFGTIFFCLLAYRSVGFIRHKGWQRVLIVVAIAAFLLVFLGQLSMEYRVDVGDVLESGRVGALLAAFIIAVPQLVIGLIQWIQRGFAEADSQKEQ